MEHWGKNLPHNFTPHSIIPLLHHSIAPASVPSLQLATVVRLPVRRPEIRANHAVAVKGDEIPRSPVKPRDRAVGPAGLQNCASRRPVAKLLGTSQILLHRDRAEFPAMLPIMIDQFLPGGKPDVGTFDVRGSRIGLDGIFRFLGLRRRGLRGPAGDGEKQRDHYRQDPRSPCPDREQSSHRSALPHVSPSRGIYHRYPGPGERIFHTVPDWLHPSALNISSCNLCLISVIEFINRSKKREATGRGQR
jgi:hypothetical protein